MMMECPTSPTLYFSDHDEPISSINGHQKSKKASGATSDQKSHGTNLTRAEMASCLLQGLEELREIESPPHQLEETKLEMSWDEESVNLGENELSPFNLEFFSPSELLSAESELPKSTGLEMNEEGHLLEEFSEIEMGNVQWETDESMKKFNDEFQAILASIPNNPANHYDVDVISIAGILGQENEDQPLMSSELNDEEMDIELEEAADAAMKIMNFDTMLNEEAYDQIIVLKNEPICEGVDEGVYIIGAGPSPAQFSGVDIEDEQASQAEKILDALLEGDLTKAESLCSTKQKEAVKIEPKPKKTAARSSNTQQAKTRKRKRGRMNGTQNLAIKSRKLRKKEQNKTAATRYRQKKKLELVSMVGTETTLDEENQDLLRQKENIEREVKMVKQLLRELFDAKKKSKKRSA